MSTMRRITIGIVATLTGALATAAHSEGAKAPPQLPRLSEPFRVEAHGKSIEFSTGHAAPFAFDHDGDGKPDLAIWQFDGGTCRLCRNIGTAAESAFYSTALRNEHRRRATAGRFDPVP